MMVNKYRPHVWLIPEDDANRQLANGFLLHDAVDDRKVNVRAPAGGWAKVLEVFEGEYLPLLRGSMNAHVVMLIDFDENENRKERFENRIPEELKPRVFVIGSKSDPERLKGELKMTLEEIGGKLAQDCLNDAFKLWQHPQLIHNEREVQRLVQVVKPIVFQ